MNVRVCPLLALRGRPRTFLPRSGEIQRTPAMKSANFQGCPANHHLESGYQTESRAASCRHLVSWTCQDFAFYTLSAGPDLQPSRSERPRARHLGPHPGCLARNPASAWRRPRSRRQPGHASGPRRVPVGDRHLGAAVRRPARLGGVGVDRVIAAVPDDPRPGDQRLLRRGARRDACARPARAVRVHQAARQPAPCARRSATGDRQRRAAACGAPVRSARRSRSARPGRAATSRAG